MAKRSDANSRSGIGSGVVNGKERQLPWKHRARASAQHLRVKILRRGGANGRVATNISLSSMSIRASDFAVWRADWRYVACWIAKRAIASVVGVVVSSA